MFTVTAGGDVRAAHYPHLRFVTAVVKEALRLYPPVWSLGRVATKGSALGSLPVVKGTDIWLCLHRLHRDPRWYPEPERFRPERWLGNQAQRRFTYVPFGVGPRICVGQHFAMAETVLGLASMLRRFSFSPTFLSSCRGQRMDLSSAKKKYQTTSATAKQSGAPELIHKI